MGFSSLGCSRSVEGWTLFPSWAWGGVPEEPWSLIVVSRNNRSEQSWTRDRDPASSSASHRWLPSCHTHHHPVLCL